jgi:hypothetical protein
MIKDKNVNKPDLMILSVYNMANSKFDPEFVSSVYFSGNIHPHEKGTANKIWVS